MNKLFKSKIALVLYIVAALLGIFFLVMLISSISYIRNYAMSYGVGVGDLGSEAITYIFTNSISYLIYGILVFAAARVLDVVTELKETVGAGAAVAPGASDEADAVETVKAAAQEIADAKAEEMPAKGPVPPLYTERSIFNY